jgi:AraC-like DNA-binding protein
MLADDVDAATVAFEVGYESASQFNREYSRLFGQPPIRDIQRLRPQLVGQFQEAGK